MKTMRNLFLLCAGLSLFACSSDDDATQQFPEGEGAVTVKIVNPFARAISESSGTSDITVGGKITVTLTHGGSDSPVTQTIDENATSKQTVFYNVVNPTKVTVSMNGGKDSYTDINIDANGEGENTLNMQADPASIPVYGETSTFTLTGNQIDGTGENADKKFVEYQAEITLGIPVARLEVNIKGGDLEAFGSVKVLGAYLDNIKPTGNGTITNYYLEGDQSATKSATSQDSPYAILYDTYLTKSEEDVNSYVDTNAITLVKDGFAPANAEAEEGEESKKQYYAYNFYANDANGTTVDNPKFKLLLKVTKTEDSEQVIPEYQYAIITNYTTNEGTNINFENGKIYRISDLVLNSANIQVNEEGGEAAYALTAIVTQAVWNVVDNVTGVWGQGSENNNE